MAAYTRTYSRETYIPLNTSCFSKSLVEAVRLKLSVLAVLVIVLVVAGAAAEGASPCCCGLDGSRDSTRQADS